MDKHMLSVSRAGASSMILPMTHFVLWLLMTSFLAVRLTWAQPQRSHPVFSPFLFIPSRAFQRKPTQTHGPMSLVTYSSCLGGYVTREWGWQPWVVLIEPNVPSMPTACGKLALSVISTALEEKSKLNILELENSHKLWSCGFFWETRKPPVEPPLPWHKAWS